MSNLDDKLREILDTLLGEWGSSPAFESEQIAKATTKLKQAFDDEGYVNELAPSEEAVARALGFMTGAEWYERFEEELSRPKYNDKRYQNNCPECGAPYDYLEAAKKASDEKQS